MLSLLDPQTYSIVKWALVIGFLAISLGLHEMMHAWVALRCGDTTGRDLGRITPDPRPHIDPIMTIAVPAAMLFFSGGRFLFAGAKPVPVSYYRLRHPARDMMFVAAAGPLTNFAMAIVFELARKAMLAFGAFPPGKLADDVLQSVVFFNILLAVINMLPVPPLDGSRVLAYFMPAGLRDSYRRLDSIGIVLVFALFFTGVLDGVIWPAMDGLRSAVDYLTGGRWA